MATTLQQVLNLARLDLNDDDKVRWPDAKLLPFLNNIILDSTRLRKDLWLGRFLSLPEGDLLLTDDFPLPYSFVRSAADYVIARANLMNTEDGKMPVASAYLGLSAKEGGVP